MTKPLSTGILREKGRFFRRPRLLWHLRAGETGDRLLARGDYGICVSVGARGHDVHHDSTSSVAGKSATYAALPWATTARAAPGTSAVTGAEPGLEKL